MDSCAKGTMRAWIIGAAAAGMVSPGLLVAQTYQPATKPVSQLAKPPRSSTVPPRLLPTGEPIRQTAYNPEAGDAQLAQSEVQQRLKELYERDGREMPELNMATSPAQRQAVPVSQPTTSASTPPNALPRYASPPQVAPTAAKPSPNKVTSFFKKLVPGGNKKSQASAPPRQLPAPAYQQPIIQATPQNVLPPPQSFAQPQTTTPLPTISQPQPIPLPPPAAAQLPSSPVTRPAGGIPAETDPWETPDITTPAEENEVLDLPELPGEFRVVPQTANDDSDLDDDDDDEAVEAAPALPESPAAPTAPAEFSEDFPDPFASPATTQATTDSTPESEQPAEESGEVTNPYTGMTLEEEAPATIPELAPAGDNSVPADNTTKGPNSTAAKMHRIIQRTDMKGLKGFCPVTLRDQRELADSRPEFSGSYRGQKFFFASKVAQAKFEQEPARYAPAAYGADVVVLTDNQDVAEGTLDYAAWYKGRLYLFGTQETHDKFVNQPELYASPPGIE